MTHGGMQTGDADRRVRLVAREAMEQQGGGTKTRRSAVELAHVVEDHASAAMHGLDDAADVDV